MKILSAYLRYLSVEDNGINMMRKAALNTWLEKEFQATINSWLPKKEVKFNTWWLTEASVLILALIF